MTINKPQRIPQVGNLMIIGWREWVTLPELGVQKIKAKIDTGARTSALHAFDIEEFRRGRKTFVRFKIHPLQRDNDYEIACVAELVERRRIKDSGGKITERPVIMTPIVIGEMAWDIELTLINRDEMGFRMLLGRAAVRGHLLVNPGKSYVLGGKRKKKKKRAPA